MEAATILALSELITKHGVPLALRLIREWPIEEPTLEDIQNLRNLVPPAAGYFGEKKSTD